MDATENDIPSASPFKQIQGFPTLVLFKSGGNEFVPYEGARTLDALIAFMETNSNNKGGFDVKKDAAAAAEDDEEAPERDEL
jgi:protein disulfide-isomerase A1